MWLLIPHMGARRKVPRHMNTEGFALTGAASGVASDAASGAAAPGLLSAQWWWSQPAAHRVAKAAYSLAWYAKAVTLALQALAKQGRALAPCLV